MIQVAVVDTGVANLASVLAGLKRAGAEPVRTIDPAVLAEAPAVLLPGVGAFGAGVASLQAKGLADPLTARAEAGRPLLAICLGLQLLAQTSDETPGVQGLGILPTHVSRFEGDVLVPQLGWNKVVPTSGASLLTEGFAYFANSYKLDAIPEGWEGAMGDHGGPFVAAVEKGAVVGCQFHPELSGTWGQALLRRWLEVASC